MDQRLRTWSASSAFFFLVFLLAEVNLVQSSSTPARIWWVTEKKRSADVTSVNQSIALRGRFNDLCATWKKNIVNAPPSPKTKTTKKKEPTSACLRYLTPIDPIDSPLFLVSWRSTGDCWRKSFSNWSKLRICIWFTGFWFLLLECCSVLFLRAPLSHAKFDEPNNNEAFFFPLLRFDNQRAIVCLPVSSSCALLF